MMREIKRPVKFSGKVGNIHVLTIKIDEIYIRDQLVINFTLLYRDIACHGGGSVYILFLIVLEVLPYQYQRYFNLNVSKWILL